MGDDEIRAFGVDGEAGGGAGSRSETDGAGFGAAGVAVADSLAKGK